MVVVAVGNRPSCDLGFRLCIFVYTDVSDIPDIPNISTDQRHSEVGWVWFVVCRGGRTVSANRCSSSEPDVVTEKSSNIGWPGYRNIWSEGTKVVWYYGIKLALEGSQAIVFRKDGLHQAFAATCAGARYRHFDLMLSERLAGKFWFPRTPAVRTASHPPVIYGKGKSVVRPGIVFRRPAAKTMKPVNAMNKSTQRNKRFCMSWFREQS